ncbi:glutaminyl-peptide cyclotransferase [Flavobacterium sp. Sd200]|uniref:glutaminyl-peptide cyclotransferase n=1 Tax=Flavobacterium sp. Sd200 TaxID=2692211 RepID=UPI001369C970|nr:glutaminyl-peptide cyclotransferase [Flavobacterium sp. Sd200]MXN89681.1 glutaminyl-peptide cyclotransferase [Flavobacterium sp. Sd200]
MKKHNLLAVILLGALSIACNDENISFNIDASNLKGQYKPEETLPLTIAAAENTAIDSVVYYLNDTKVGSTKGNTKLDASLQNLKFGYQNIKAIVFYEGKTSEATSRIELVSNIEPKLLSYEIVNTYPHDKTSYTQGLEFYKDTLVEGTGQYQKSTLRKNNYKTGEAYKQIALEGKYFGEGITVFNNKLYQLTWKEKTGFIYNAGNLNKEKDFTYFRDVQGWGLTHDDKYLYQSDGSEKIYKLDAETLKEVDYVNVYTNTRKIKDINELEWIDGKIFANLYQTDLIVVVDPATGAVEGLLNMADLKTKITTEPETDVLNGIAYNPKTKTIFVTGKNWDKMFEIRLK